MANEAFKLPGSSLEALEKIIQGYANISEKDDLDALAKLLSMNKNVVSNSNGFLVETNIVSGGKQKTITELGRKLGRALQHNHVEDTERLYREVVNSTEFLATQVTTVRLKNGMSKDDLATHILYVSGQKDTKQYRTGARTVADVLIKSGLIEENDGLIYVSTPTTPEEYHSTSDQIDDSNDAEPERFNAQSNIPERKVEMPVESLSSRQPNVSINIELVLPPTENAEIYEKLFKALRENLFLSDG